VVRIGINWAGLQPRPGDIQWSSLDPLVASLHAHGIRAVGMILTSPRWAWNLLDCGGYCFTDPAGIAMPPADNPRTLGFLQSFVASTVDRYNKMYPGEFVGLEIWQEQNIQGWWQALGGVNPARYTRLLCAAYAGVRSVDPSLPVIFGGLGNLSTTITKWGVVKQQSVSDFLDGAYWAGAAHCMTAMAVHPYTFNLEPPDGPNNHFLSALSTVRQRAAMHGDAGRALWITEFGYYTGCRVGFPQCQATNFQDQANFLECSYQLVASMPDVKALLVLTLYDYAGQQQMAPDQMFGIFQNPGTPKPAVTMFTKLFRTFGSAVPAITSCNQAFHWQA
jgi:hypothetical protein